MGLLVLEDVRKTFHNGELEEEILKGISLSLQPGEVTALVGASGSGKSTLLTIAAGLQSTSEGVVQFNGENLSAMKPEQVRKLRASQFGFVFQFAHLVPFLTVEEQLLVMLDVAEFKLRKAEKKEKVHQLLQLIDMGHRKHAYPSVLSGGEKQRVAIARAIIHEPKVLFADEPTASLDSKKSKEVMALIHDLTKRLNISTLMVTHDEEMLVYTDRFIRMMDGKIV
ncbi:ABC transporter ATP-binding protein [Ornithinibacillus californiensis]|uniref:ABC transporter ATP-binding protein n=1 Tax=Ornithinibacillus californiensis TaxID=161536 RepID=UPI00064D8E15|nr:ABC transporter ATP-binding protein [Ornithinibacillus californiensis]